MHLKMSAILSAHKCVSIPLNGVYINGDPIHWLISMPRLTIYIFKSHAWPDSLSIFFFISWTIAWIRWYSFVEITGKNIHHKAVSWSFNKGAKTTKVVHIVTDTQMSNTATKWETNRGSLSFRYYQSLKGHCYYRVSTLQASAKHQGKTFQCFAIPCSRGWIDVQCYTYNQPLFW